MISIFTLCYIHYSRFGQASVVCVVGAGGVVAFLMFLGQTELLYIPTQHDVQKILNN